MHELARHFMLEHLKEARGRVQAKFDELKPDYDDATLSKLLFRTPLDRTNDDSKLAHLQAIRIHLDYLLEQDPKLVKVDSLHLEFSKSLTLFERFTGMLGTTSGTHGDYFLTSQQLYRDAIGSYKNFVACTYQGDLDFSYIPIKLRLAIEIYFKNMIGFNDAKVEIPQDRKPSIAKDYPLSIAELLKFFSHKKYKKYAKLPIDLEIVRDINYWSNNLVHSGVISFAWQNLAAVDFLDPLFNIQHENGNLSTEGFNYLDLNYKIEDLADDLGRFLSRRQKVTINLSPRMQRPVEGSFYYPAQVGQAILR